MPQIGWLEILIIVSIAIIIVGPKDFPLMLKKMGSWLGSIKRYVSDVQNQVSEITDETIDQENKIKEPIDKKNNLKDKNG
jgi:sec-independent protein translocase protein TatB|tara:strand:+ start:142 stop:381 length:240 start_codon:yes stop_codon:yes gene_type:complete